MLTRIISSVVATALVIVLLVFRATIAVPIALAILCGIAAFEIFKATKTQSNLLFFVSSLVFAVIIPFIARGYIPIALNSAYYIYFIVFAICLIFKFDPNSLASNFVAMIMNCVITFGLVSAQTLLDLKHGMFYFLLAAFCAFITDSGAYFVGSAVGRIKLSPKVSPKKTVEGAIGGVVCCVIVCITFAYIYAIAFASVKSVQLLPLIICVFLASFAGMIGDLFASSVKRSYNVKDYGKIMPGHGGVVDRCDSVCITFPVVMLFAQQIVLIA